MANTGVKGVDVRQTGTALIFRAFTTASGAVVSTGTATFEIIEIQSDGTIKSYDFNDNTFKTTACTTFTVTPTHRTANNSTVNTGIWTYALSTLTGFTVGAMYEVTYRNSTATDAPVQVREFQYGSAEGDLKTTANGTGVAELNTDSIMILGTTYVGAAGFFVDWAQVQNKTSTVALTNTTTLQVSSCLSYPNAEVVNGTGTIVSATSTTCVLQTALGFDNACVGMPIFSHTGTGAGQGRRIASYVNSTKTVTFDRALDVTWDNTTTYRIPKDVGPEFDSSLRVIAASVVGNVGGSVASVTAGVTVTTNNDKTGYALSQSFPSNFASMNIDSSGRMLLQPSQPSVTIPTVTTVGTLTTYTGNTPQTGDSYARIGAPAGASTAADIAAINAKTTNLPALPASTTNITAGTIATVSGNVNGNVLGNVAGSVATLGTLPVVPTDWLTAAGVKADAVTKIQSGLATTTNLALVQAKTDNLPSDPADESLIIAATDALATLIGALNNVSTAQIATALFVDGATNKLKVNSDHSVDASIDSLAGSGANTVTITVNDGATAIQGATVTAKVNGSIVGSATTNVSGVAVLALDNSMPTIVITASGFNGSSASLAISGDTIHTYSLTAISITPSTPPAVTGYAYTYEADGTTIKPNVAVYYRMTRTETGDTGAIVSDATSSVTSNGSGLAQFSGLRAGATYQAKTDTMTNWHSFVADDVTFAIKSFIG